MNWRLGFAAVCAHLVLTGAASAAVLANLQGDVQYSRPGSTSGFLPAANGMELRPGDLVMARNGRGILVYNENCQVEIRPNTSVDVQSVPPCKPAVVGESGQTGMIIGGTALVGAGVGAYFLFRGEGASEE